MPFCERNVTAFPILGGGDLDRALEKDDDVEVTHMTDDAQRGDHRWRLIKQEKDHLRKWHQGDKLR